MCVHVGKRSCHVCVYVCELTAFFVLLFSLLSLFIDGSTTWLSRTRFVVVVEFDMSFGGCK